MDTFQFRAMNTDVVLAAEGAPDAIALGFERARAFIQAGESRFTRFIDTSELSRLNRSGGAWFQASADLFDVVEQARAYAVETDGLFAPTILDALEAAGYDKSMDALRTQGATRKGRSAVRPPSAFEAIELDEAACAIRLPAGTRIDLGGIAKGWIVERAARMLAEYTDACVVNAGGDLFAVGRPNNEGGAWLVELEDPRDATRTIAVLDVGPGALATSSITKRRWRRAGRLQHHLIDRRRGLPAETDCLSVTVLASQATMAEVYAKALLIAGTGDAARIGAQRDITFIVVDAAGQVWGSARAKEVLNVHLQLA